MVFSLYEMLFVLCKMLYRVSLLGVLVTLMLFSLSINCERHISLLL